MVKQTKRYAITIRGNVQHIGYRGIIEGAARKMDIRGYVFNDTDSSVNIVCEGQAEYVDNFLNVLKDFARADIETIEKKEIQEEFPLPKSFSRVATDEYYEFSRKFDIGLDYMAGIKTDTGEMKGTLKDVKTTLKDMKGTLQDVNTGIGDMKGSLQEVNTGIGGMKGTLQDVNTGIGGMRGSLQDVNTGIGDMKGSLQDVNTGIGDMRGTLQDVNTGIGDMRGTLQDVNTGIGDMKGTLNSIDNTLGGFTGEQREHNKLMDKHNRYLERILEKLAEK